eukprot:2831907-Amphidinium_carterae.1
MQLSVAMRQACSQSPPFETEDLPPPQVAKKISKTGTKNTEKTSDFWGGLLFGPWDWGGVGVDPRFPTPAILTSLYFASLVALIRLGTTCTASMCETRHQSGSIEQKPGCGGRERILHLHYCNSNSATKTEVATNLIGRSSLQTHPQHHPQHHEKNIQDRTTNGLCWRAVSLHFSVVCSLGKRFVGKGWWHSFN